MTTLKKKGYKRILAIDFGSTNFKAALFDDELNIQSIRKRMA